MSLVDALNLKAIVEARSDAELVSGLSEAESLQNTPYPQLVQLRVLAFPRLAAAIADPEGKMAAWAERMTAKFGLPVVVLNPGTQFEYPLPWLAAFAVIWKGEAPSHWPMEWTDEHVARAALWESGEKVPDKVSGKNTLHATMT